jgi:pimeloyl-ACP methyl ester carboxylesterase
MGRSLGSAAAIEVAAHTGERLAGMIIESGFARTFALLSRLGIHIEGADEERDGFGNLSKIKRVSLPTLILHGQDDRLIPPSEGHSLYEHSAAQQKRLVIIPRAGHNDIMHAGKEQHFQAIREFVHG